MRQNHRFLLLSAVLLHAVQARADVFKLDDEQVETVKMPVVSKPAAKPQAPLPVRRDPPETPKTLPAPVPDVSIPPSLSPPAPAVAAADHEEEGDEQAEGHSDAELWREMFPIYREARGNVIKGDFKAAFRGFSRVIAAGKKRRQHEKGESALEAVALVEREKIRWEQGDKGDKANAIKNLRKFCQDDPDGSYRGEAMLFLARERADAEDLDGAATGFGKLAQWVRAIRREDGAKLAGCPRDILEKLMPARSAWAKEPDCFGNAIRRKWEPAWLVHEETAPWYLDELEHASAQWMGFDSYRRGGFSDAGKAWAALAELEPKVAPAAGRWPGIGASHRLAFAAQAGRMLAYPGEEGLFSAYPKAKERLAHAEFAYLTGYFSKAERGVADLLFIDDALKAGEEDRLRRAREGTKKARMGVWVSKPRNEGLGDIQRDYLQAILGTILARSGRASDALARFESVFARGHNSVTERRCVLAYINCARVAGSAAQRKRADVLEAALLASPVRDRFSCMARVWRAEELTAQGRREEARMLWSWFRPEDGVFHELAKKRMPRAKAMAK